MAHLDGDAARLRRASHTANVAYRPGQTVSATLVGDLEVRIQSTDTVAELIAEHCRKSIPPLKLVVDFETASSVLSLASETAEQNRSVPRRPGAYCIVFVAGSGNSYAQF
jgi:hypothetical protein